MACGQSAGPLRGTRRGQLSMLGVRLIRTGVPPREPDSGEAPWSDRIAIAADETN